MAEPWTHITETKHVEVPAAIFGCMGREHLTYYRHREHSPEPPVADLIKLLPEYIFFWGRFRIVVLVKIPRIIWVLLKRLLKRLGLME